MRPTVLFADNERNIRRFCQQELEAAGFQVALAEDGDVALEIIDRMPVDLVILDEHMPRCCGLQAATRIKRWYPNLPIILFTLDRDYEGFKTPVVDAVVIKSEDLSSLLAIMGRLLPMPRSTATSERYPVTAEASS